MITRADLKRFAPKARAEYVDALMGGLELLREAGILESEHRLCHFMAQVGHETGGLTIIRESMKYTPKRMREVWPSRFRNKPEAELRAICSDPVRMSDAVYGGRMGNRRGTADGFDFRGAGWIQTTGRHAFEKYAGKLELPADDASLARYAGDLGILLKFAALEWKASGCNEWSDENDLTKVCKAINTGSATSSVKPVGMSDRQRWFAKAWGIWGDKGMPDVPNDDGMTIRQKVGVGLALGGATVGERVVSDPVGSLNYVAAIKTSAAPLLPSGLSLGVWLVPLLIGGALIALLIWKERRA